jgi:hypothetical protein
MTATCGILFKKYCIIGHAIAAWFNLPTIDSSRVSDTLSLDRMIDRSLSHRLNLVVGNEIDNNLVFTIHPKIAGDSDNLPSSYSFSKERQSSLRMGSFLSKGWHKVCSANNIACNALLLLLPQFGSP